MSNIAGICPNCLNDAIWRERGITEQGREFTMFKCPNCHSDIRVFDVPQTEHEVVLKAIVEEPRKKKKIPAREEAVERQLRLF